MFSAFLSRFFRGTYSAVLVRFLWRSLGQKKLFVGHREASHVPEDPEDQADEDEEGPREDEEVPEAEGGKDPQEEEDESHHVEDDGQREEEGAATFL